MLENLNNSDLGKELINKVLSPKKSPETAKAPVEPEAGK